jgi:hypothetical protein
MSNPVLESRFGVTVSLTIRVFPVPLHNRVSSDVYVGDGAALASKEGSVAMNSAEAIASQANDLTTLLTLFYCVSRGPRNSAPRRPGPACTDYISFSSSFFFLFVRCIIVESAERMDHGEFVQVYISPSFRMLSAICVLFC